MANHETIAAEWWTTDEFGCLREADLNANQQPIADAHNALAIQMETGWHAEKDRRGGWYVPCSIDGQGHDTKTHYSTPVQAILAAWEWAKKREGEVNGQQS